jgi:hypothetical protein
MTARAMFCCFLALAAPASAAGQAYQPAEIVDWKTRSFTGRTDYALVPAGESGAEHDAVRAVCRNRTASGRVVEREHDLADAPVLEWRWRVDAVYDGIDETEKRGDDYPARIYVVAERWPNFRSRAINYVWSSTQPQGATWENAYASQFMMVSVRAGEARLGEWITEQRDVLADFRRLHDLDPGTIDALAIMTDCDNAGQSATAFYGPIRWKGIRDGESRSGER